MGALACCSHYTAPRVRHLVCLLYCMRTTSLARRSQKRMTLECLETHDRRCQTFTALLSRAGDTANTNLFSAAARGALRHYYLLLLYKRKKYGVHYVVVCALVVLLSLLTLCLCKYVKVLAGSAHWSTVKGPGAPQHYWS